MLQNLNPIYLKMLIYNIVKLWNSVFKIKVVFIEFSLIHFGNVHIELQCILISQVKNLLNVIMLSTWASLVLSSVCNILW